MICPIALHHRAGVNASALFLVPTLEEMQVPVSIRTLAADQQSSRRTDDVGDSKATEQRRGDSPIPPLRVPQARVLRGLMPAYPDDPVSEWPCLTRVALAARAGYTAISGSVTRALNGILPGSSSGDPHIGLIGLGYVEMLNIDVEGVDEQNYRITRSGIIAYQSFIDGGGKLPPVKEVTLCVNHRYRKEEGEDSEQHSQSRSSERSNQ